MNRTFIFCITFICLFVSKAKCDRFIFNGDTSYLFIKSPLEQYPQIEAMRPKLVDFNGGCYDCGCTRYDAEWSIINNELYLTNIYSCPYSSKALKANINSLFNVTDGKVKAIWVTDSLWSNKGKPFAHFDVMMSFYKAETCVSIINGRVASVKEFNYPDSKESIYVNNDAERNKFIYSNINWDKIPDLGKDIKRVIVNFTAGVSGNPQNITVMRGGDEVLYKNEASRVVEMLPWSTLYYHGKPYRESWIVPVVFSEENREKYTH